MSALYPTPVPRTSCSVAPRHGEVGPQAGDAAASLGVRPEARRSGVSTRGAPGADRGVSVSARRGCPPCAPSCESRGSSPSDRGRRAQGHGVRRPFFSLPRSLGPGPPGEEAAERGLARAVGAAPPERRLERGGAGAPGLASPCELQRSPIGSAIFRGLDRAHSLPFFPKSTVCMCVCCGRLWRLFFFFFFLPSSKRCHC